ncbi:MAG TPA: STAS domain-containing protein [Terriglobales bacterium]|jgi:anti-sigma B factor antagonist|nr:STAS domain-containing protein [Terriglobales bacterium]
METAIGVFSSRDDADEAIKQLRQSGVPDESVIFLTRSESEFRNVVKDFGTVVGGVVGGAAGMSAGVVAATLLIPGVGPVFALGFGAAALLGLAGAGAGHTVGASALSKQEQPTPDEKCSEDATFFREVLKEGRSLIVVRTESEAIASDACAILDRLGMGIQGKTPLKMEAATRQVRDIVVIDISGRISLGEGNVMLREMVHELAAKGNKKIILNLGEVTYMDSSGLGELVKAHTTIRNKGGHLKLANLNKRVHDLLQMTRLSAVFDIQKDEESALGSFGESSAAQAVA